MQDRAPKLMVAVAIVVGMVVSLVSVADAGWRRSFSSESTDITEERICEGLVEVWTSTTMAEGIGEGLWGPNPAFGVDTRDITEQLYTDATLSTVIVEVTITETVLSQQGGAGSNYVLEGFGSAVLPPEYQTGDVIYAGNYNPETFSDDSFALTVGDPIYECEPEVESEGCRPGFWKWHWGAWEDYGLLDRFSEVFENGPRRTLIGVLWTWGGEFRALRRHAVAGLLNAANDGVNYPYSEAEVIALVDDAYDSGDWRSARDTLREANQLGCPL